MEELESDGLPCASLSSGNSENHQIAEMALNRPEKLANDKEYNITTGLVNLIVKQQ